MVIFKGLNAFFYVIIYMVVKVAITKTDFINYTRCRRYPALENIRKEKLESDLTVEEYLKEENKEKLREIMGMLFDTDEETGEEVDLTKKVDKQLNAMMDYYKEIEVLAALEVEKTFGGKSIYSKDTFMQESFDYDLNGIKYLCYVDIYNECNDEINIIEVKATTNRKYNELNYKIDDVTFPLFMKKNGIFYLNKPNEPSDSYNKKIWKLSNRYSDEGKYIYDLSVQRYIIDNYYKKEKKINYYLAVLNSEYIYDGKTENGKNVYTEDENGNNIIVIYNMNEITDMYQIYVEADREKLERSIYELDDSPCKVSKSCELKKRTECKFKPICFSKVPSKNASYNYKRFISFKANGIKYDKYDLINEGYYSLGDVPKEWLTNSNHIIQRECYDENKIYINKEKIKAGLNSLSYPIYHLDFETFPCPIPRFKGEKPYTQSCFEFSLHIERKPGECDKDKDNYVFLATSNIIDQREEMVKMLVEKIDVSKSGCMLAQNVSFEKGRIKELSVIFPKYKKELLQIHDSGRDLLEIIDNNKSLYKSLGFDEYNCSTVNYYNNEQSGSYSIKKTLPLFTNLTYHDLEVQNGVEALVEYSLFDKMTKEELDKSRNALTIYCKQDTWAMVEILRGVRNLIKW